MSRIDASSSTTRIGLPPWPVPRSERADDGSEGLPESGGSAGVDQRSNTARKGTATARKLHDAYPRSKRQTLGRMGLDLYVGTMTRYLSADWKTIVQHCAESTGTPIHMVRTNQAVDAVRH